MESLAGLCVNVGLSQVGCSCTSGVWPVEDVSAGTGGATRCSKHDVKVGSAANCCWLTASGVITWSESPF